MFGAPVPLPGQPGFRAKPSDSMARETAEMEERLSRLKTDLAAEAEMREASGPKVGGARWRSARTDRGSVRAYVKDVKVRHKEQLQQRPPHVVFASSFASGGGAAAGGGQTQPQAGAGARAAAALRDEQRQRHHHRQSQSELAGNPSDPRTPTYDQHALAHPGFKAKEVSRWSVGDTLEWLESLGLGKHKGVFQQNEISGPILLEVGLDDLDYMKVHVLAHRKQILKGIEELRRGSRHPNADMPPPPVPAPPAPRGYPSNTDTIDCDAGTRGESVPSNKLATSMVRGEDHRRNGLRPPPERIKKKHWSHIEPIVSGASHTGGRGGGGSGVGCGRLLSTNPSDEQFDRATVRLVSSSGGAVAQRPGEPNPGEERPFLRQPPEVGHIPFSETTGAASATAVGVPAVRRQTVGKTLLAGSGMTGCWTNPFPALNANNGDGTTTMQEDDQLVELHSEFAGSPPRFAKAATLGTEQAPRHHADSAAPLDEEAEHEAFRAAVAEWNRGGNPGSTHQIDGRGAKYGGGGDANQSDKDGGRDATRVTDRSDCASSTATVAAAVKRTTEMMADELRSQMDAEHRRQAQELEEKKKGLLEGLATARGMRSDCGAENADYGGEDPVAGRSEGISREFGGDPGEGRGGGAWYEVQRSRGEGKEVDDDWHEIDDRSVSSSTSCQSTAWCSSGSEVVRAGEEGLGQSGRDVEIVFMESVLGVDSAAGEEGSYLVDEVESDNGHDL